MAGVNIFLKFGNFSRMVISKAANSSWKTACKSGYIFLAVYKIDKYLRMKGFLEKFSLWEGFPRQGNILPEKKVSWAETSLPRKLSLPGKSLLRKNILCRDTSSGKVFGKRESILFRGSGGSSWTAREGRGKNYARSWYECLVVEVRVGHTYVHRTSPPPACSP